MNVCAVVAEYNPLHLGHVKHLSYIREVLGAKYIVVVMSGNFTQRGEPAVLDKFTRARHAVLAGADLVIELPTVFATSNAEIFAKGAIKTILSLGIADAICFGAESGTKDDFINLAKALNNESKEFKKLLKEKLDSGISLVKARFETVKELGMDFDESLISTPNNILGIEYVKAILSQKSDIEIYPMIRTGNHNDKTFKKGITSASSIRELVKIGKIKKLKKSMPNFVYRDLTPYPFVFEKLIMGALLRSSAEELAEISDCTEGLENRLKALAKDNTSLTSFTEKAVTKRYTLSRINRILIANLLGIKNSFVKDCLCEPLYAKVLAVNSVKKELITMLSENSSVPILTRKSDYLNLKKTAKKCFGTDIVALDTYNLATETRANENNTLFI